MSRTTAELAAEVFPDVSLRRELGTHETLLSIDKARRELGYEPRYGWRDSAAEVRAGARGRGRGVVLAPGGRRAGGPRVRPAVAVGLPADDDCGRHSERYADVVAAAAGEPVRSSWWQVVGRVHRRGWRPRLAVRCW